MSENWEVGVLGLPVRIYVNVNDVKYLLGCQSNKAYECIRATNEQAKKKGVASFPIGKANKYLFAERYGIPLEDVDKAIIRGGG